MQTQLLSLVDYLAYMTCCENVSDLHVMDDTQRWYAHGALEKVPAETYPLKEWNDALCYVTKHPPQSTCAGARAELMAFLARRGDAPHGTAHAGRRHGFETNAHQARRRPLCGSFLSFCLAGLGLVSR